MKAAARGAAAQGATVGARGCVATAHGACARHGAAAGCGDGGDEPVDTAAAGVRGTCDGGGGGVFDTIGMWDDRQTGCPRTAPAKTIEGARPIRAAAQNGHVRVVATPVELRAEVNVQDTEGVRLLRYVAQEGHADVTATLVELPKFRVHSARSNTYVSGSYSL